VSPVPPGTTVSEAKAIGEENRRLILEYLRSFEDAAEPPSIRTIASAVGLSTTSVHWHLQRLVESGEVSKDDLFPAECHHCGGTGTVATTKYRAL
jgi:hypothetical protein